MIHCGSVGSGDDEKCAVEIRWIEFAAVPGEFVGRSKCLDLGQSLGCDDLNERIRLEQALNFVERNVAGADDEHAPRYKFEEDG